MKIMLIEDDDNKAGYIAAHIKSRGVPSGSIVRAKNMAEFAAGLNQDFGLFIIDIKFPTMDGVASSRNGEAVLEAIVKAGRDGALLLAISSYPKDFPGIREKFEARGCILADYSKLESWKSTLDHLLIQLNKQTRFDFLIFCALQAERNPYIPMFNEGKRAVRGDVNCFDIEINGKTGSVVLLPKMGLVNAAVTAGVCIDRFKPSIVGMSGICGGFRTRANLGQLFVSSMAYEYQSGKWVEDGFQQEPYQVSTDHVLATRLDAMLEDEGLLAELEAGFVGVRPSGMHRPAMGIFTSGSAVIAQEKYMDQVKDTHRKVNAVDMEVFAVQRAAELSPHKPLCICAKTVVDLGNNEKNDGLHVYGSLISARFLVKALSSVL